MPEWLGKAIDCNYCGGKYKLEPGDKARLIYDQRDGDYWEVKCPNCGHNMGLAAS